MLLDMRSTSIEQVRVIPNKPVIVVTCDEPEGKIERSVYPMYMTKENLLMFWDKAKEFKSLFWTDIKDEKDFMNILMYDAPDNTVEARGLFWVIDDFVGVFYLTDIKPMIDAKVHYSFFDRRQKGRSDLVRKMLEYAFNRYKFRRLSAEIPMHASRSVFNFAESVGFRAEGRKRKAVQYKDDWFDVKMFGILSEEVLNGNGD